MKKNKSNIKHIDLDKIENPSFLSTLSYAELNVLAEDIRKEIIEKTSIYGGHLSSNLGTVELTIALNRVFDFSKDKIIFDVGHQCYTYKILTGRNLDNLRQKDGLSGFQKRSESPYDVYEAGHSSTSISAASGFATSRDLNKENYDVIAFIGDASIVSGLAFEALNNLASSKHKVIIVLNDNGMSISKPVGGLGKAFANISTAAGYNRMKIAYKNSLLKSKFGKKIYHASAAIKNWIKRILVPSNIFDAMGLSYIGPIDGHNIKKIEKALKRAKNTTKSVVIHACTLKGKGYELAEQDEIGYWHGVSPFDIKTGKPHNLHVGKNSWSHIYSEITMKIMEEHKKAFLISPATQKGAGLDCVFEKYADRCLDVGIAEEHAMTFASGLSLSGYHPIVSIYSTFMQRAFDEISHDLARMKINATILVDRSGLVGADGETHQGIYDLSFLVNTPNTIVAMASSVEEAITLYEESFKNHGTFFIRLPRTLAPYNKNEQPAKIEFGKWIKLINSDSKDKIIVSVGPVINALKDLIIENKLDISLYNAIYIKPLDLEAINDLTNYKNVYIYDPYSTLGGLGSTVIDSLVELNYKGDIKTFTVPLEFVKQATINEQLEDYKLLPEQVIKQIIE